MKGNKNNSNISVIAFLAGVRNGIKNLYAELSEYLENLITNGTISKIKQIKELKIGDKVITGNKLEKIKSKILDGIKRGLSVTAIVSIVFGIVIGDTIFGGRESIEDKLADSVGINPAVMEIRSRVNFPFLTSDINPETVRTVKIQYQTWQQIAVKRYGKDATFDNLIDDVTKCECLTEENKKTVCIYFQYLSQVGSIINSNNSIKTADACEIMYKVLNKDEYKGEITDWGEYKKSVTGDSENIVDYLNVLFGISARDYMYILECENPKNSVKLNG